VLTLLFKHTPPCYKIEYVNVLFFVLFRDPPLVVRTSRSFDQSTVCQNSMFGAKQRISDGLNIEMIFLTVFIGYWFYHIISYKDKYEGNN